jgi:hypothetical protein
MPHAERGVALLEAVVALTIVGVSGIAAVLAVQQGLDGERRAVAEERLYDGASRVLAGVAVLESRELTRHIGDHADGPFVIRVQRPAPELFRLAVMDSGTLQTELLVTVVHRREEP